jgi:hypothetical protein
MQTVCGFSMCGFSAKEFIRTLFAGSDVTIEFTVFIDAVAFI